MFAMFDMFFSALTHLFSAVDKGAQTVDTLAEVGLDRSKAFKAEQDLTNRSRLIAAQKLLEQ